MMGFALFSFSFFTMTMAWSLTLSLIGILAAASFLFLSLPFSSSCLYVRTLVGRSCITANEWIWMAVWSFVLVFVSLLPPFKEKEKGLTVNQHISAGRHCTTTRVFRWFVAVNLFWMVFAVQGKRERLTINSSLVVWMDVLGACAAWPALWNLACVTIPVQRTSKILQALGLSVQESMQFHFWVGHAIGFWLVVHTVLLSIVYAIKTESLHEWLSLMLPYTNMYTEGIVNFAGWMGLIMFAALWLTSRPCFRTRGFESFYWLHLIFSAFFVFFSNLHDYNTYFFLQPAFASWIADLLQRCSRTERVHVEDDTSPPDGLVRNSGTLVLSATKEAPVVCVSLPIPPGWRNDMETYAYVYIGNSFAPGSQAHPFSISSFNRKTQYMTLHIKALGDWTTGFVKHVQRLIEMASDGASEPLTLCDSLQLHVQGPYGGNAIASRLDSHGRCLFLAGGVGLTGVSGLIRSRHEQGKKSVLVWLVRTRHEARVMFSLLQDLSDGIGRDDGGDDNVPTTMVEVYLTQEDSCSLSFADLQGPLPSISVPIRYQSSDNRGDPPIFFMIPAIISIVLSFVLARVLCCSHNQQDGEEGQLVHHCSSLFSMFSSACSYCSIDDQDGDLPCCTVPICFYCFRGAPMILAFLAVAPLTVLLMRLSSTLLQLRRSIMKHSNFFFILLDCEEEEERREQEVNPETGGAEEPLMSCLDGSFGPSTNIAVSTGSVDLERLLSTGSSQDDPFGALVVCGPQSLVRSAQRHSSLPVIVISS